MHARSTVISEPVQSSGFRYGLLGKTTGSHCPDNACSASSGGGRVAVEGKIKGLVAPWA